MIVKPLDEGCLIYQKSLFLLNCVYHQIYHSHPVILIVKSLDGECLISRKSSNTGPSISLIFNIRWFPFQGNFRHSSSTRRIKKEIRNKRTSFLGIESQVDDSYLDFDLTLAPRPDITSFLQEETKIEKLLYKKTLSHDMDSKLRESRDSGVDVDRGPSAEAWYKGQSSPENSNPHSRQNSEVRIIYQFIS